MPELLQPETALRTPLSQKRPLTLTWLMPTWSVLDFKLCILILISSHLMSNNSVEK